MAGAVLNVVADLLPSSGRRLAPTVLEKHLLVANDPGNMPERAFGSRQGFLRKAMLTIVMACLCVTGAAYEASWRVFL